jgi:hypothetical protein
MKKELKKLPYVPKNKEDLKVELHVTSVIILSNRLAKLRI